MKTRPDMKQHRYWYVKPPSWPTSIWSPVKCVPLRCLSLHTTTVLLTHVLILSAVHQMSSRCSSACAAISVLYGQTVSAKGEEENMAKSSHTGKSNSAFWMLSHLWANTSVWLRLLPLLICKKPRVMCGCTGGWVNREKWKCCARGSTQLIAYQRSSLPFWVSCFLALFGVRWEDQCHSQVCLLNTLDCDCLLSLVLKCKL